MDEATEFDGYDAGARAGMFDKCNGRPPIDMSGFPSTPFNIGFADGYADAYTTNEDAFA